MTKVPQDILRKSFRNALSTEIKADLIFAERFTKRQLEIFSVNPHLRIRSLCSSGISIDFYSDTERIKLNYAVFEKAREWMYFDLFVNNKYTESSGFDTIQDETGCVEFNVSNPGMKKNRITIYLPHLVRIAISGLEISSGASLTMSRNPKNTILCLGDSITQGMEAKRPSSMFPLQLAKHFKMNLINQGIGGYVFDKRSLESDFEFSPQIITVAYGTNDWEVVNSLSEFNDMAFRYFEKLTDKFAKASIFVITPTWRSDINEPRKCGTFFELSSSLVKICAKFPQLKLINGLSMVPNDAALFPDGLHPGDKGFNHYSLNLIREIEKNGFIRTL